MIASMPAECSPQQLKLRQHLATAATVAIDANLADTTLKRYATSVRFFNDMTLATGNRSSSTDFIPVTPALLVLYVSFLAERRNAASTIYSHLSAIRQECMKRGLPDPYINGSLPPMVVATINGNQRILRLNQMDTDDADASIARMPITTSMVKSLLIHSHTALSSAHERAQFCAMSLMAFTGAMRIGELAPPSFDPKLHLNIKDVIIQTDEFSTFVKAYLRTSESDRAFKGVNILCIDFPGPLSVAESYRNYSAHRSAVPGDHDACFISSGGIPITYNKFRDQLNTVCRAANLPVGIMCHSFREGAATMMHAHGVPRDKIALFGRWTSDAVDLYIFQSTATRKELTSAIVSSLL
jgi:hypothetical protein